MGKMSLSVVRGVKNLLSIRGGQLKKLRMSWFGGEPMMAYDVVENLLRFTIEEMPGTSDTTIESNMTTNGWLLSKEKLRNLSELNCKTFQISLDGDKAEHDKLRILANGKGTFDSIWTNLVGAHKTDIDFTAVIRLHINTMNVESMRSLIQRFGETFNHDSRFQLYIRGLSRLGGKNDPNLPVMDQVSLIRIVDELKLLSRSLGISLYDYHPEVGGYQCYASKFNSFIIRSNGRVGKCTTALYDQRNTIGQLMENGKLEIDKEKFSWWVRGNFTGSEEQLNCPLLAN